MLETELAEYVAANEKNLPMFLEMMTEIVFTDDQLVQFRELAGKPVWFQP